MAVARPAAMTSAASAGGAAGASGVGLQNRVFGWVATAMVAEQPLLAPNFVAGTVVRVGAQTGFYVDDVAAETDAGNFALFQVKAGMSLGKSPHSPLAKALEQAVDQYLIGTVPSPSGTQRAIDPLRDALVICTDAAAPATIKDDLRFALARTGSQPAGTPLGQELTVRQRTALAIVLGHTRRLWAASGHAAPDNEHLRSFLRVLRVITVDANDGGSDHAAAMAVLSTVLSVPGAAVLAWPELVAEGQAASVGRDWRDRAAISLALSRRGVVLSPPARYTDDIRKLRDLSAMNARALASEAVLPVLDGLHIRRGVSTRLAADAGEENVLVIGEAGAGKSAVAQEFTAGRSKTQEVVVLRAVDIAGTNRIPLEAPLRMVLWAWTGSTGVVLIDGVDALRGAEDQQFLSQLVVDLRGSRWQIVATVRTFDARNNQQFQRAFFGLPVSNDPAEVDARLPQVRHLVVGDLTDDELNGALVPPLELASLLAKAPPQLRALLRNPFNLRLAAQVAENLPGAQHEQLLEVRSRVGLLEAYWDSRVRNQDSTARVALLSRLAREMASSRNLRVVEAEPTVTAVDSTAMQAMLSENVLTCDPGALPAARRVLSFSHNILFDYAAALYLLFDPIDPSRLVITLDHDPSLPLVARPSFEILVELLWEQRATGSLWPLSLDLAGSSHVLASLAFAAKLLNLIRAADDLAPLAPVLGRVDRHEGLWPQQILVGQIVGALRTPAVLNDLAPAVVPLAALARSLATNAGASYLDAVLAADLLVGLQLRLPVRVGDPGASDRGQAVAILLDACRADPQRRESLAGAAARQLPSAIGWSAVAREAVERLLEDGPALRQWGGTVLAWLAEAVAPVLSVDPDLARRIASAVLTFEETRDEQVDFGGSGALLPLHESRKQQALHGTYRLGKAFSQICSADLKVAAEIFCDLTDHTSMPELSDRWPVSGSGAVGWLQYGRDLSMTPHGVGKTAAVALSAALASADSATAHVVVTILIERLHSAAAWAALMESAGEGVALGRALLPVLDSGALLAHHDTHPSAAKLLASVAAHNLSLTGRLEAAVLRAHELVDANGGWQETKDALIGCLRPDAVTSVALRARLEELGPDGPPNVRPRPSVTVTSEPWSMLDGLSEQGVELKPNVETAARALEEELRTAVDGQDTRPETERRLPEMFAKADAAFASQDSLPAALELLLVNSAATLARDPRVLPGTPVADRLLAVLLRAAASPDAGSFLS